MDRHPDRAEHLADVTPSASAVASLFDIIDQADLVVECASIQAARDIALSVLTKGTDLMLLSIGALVDADFRDQVYAAALRTTVAFISRQAPSGASTHSLQHQGGNEPGDTHYDQAFSGPRDRPLRHP